MNVAYTSGAQLITYHGIAEFLEAVVTTSMTAYTIC
jgi:hypothetical protein